jgi:hypothetical protein
MDKKEAGLEEFVDCMKKVVEKEFLADVPREVYKMPLSPEYVEARLRSFDTVPLDVSADP